ncbi:hypothetical protein UA08_09209 [Talaromyces atroroseus]|uniref:NADP-dependent oxidoreductase domain-containing protein n=1 Tax=Talaromyces atroroseus TaxID=1441469 RepID=A0A1Q5Q6Q4_TALAT|nr:hypothetical protein UA08_09209 [Talaromyces atroroseus]OKL55524.1 hypothetical protein UA08_09209 [Talaromyces atroroseus]
MSTFNPATDIPSLTGKVILITGANTGIGKETIISLAKHNPDKIYLASRDKGRANQAIDDIQKAVPGAPIEFIPLDLASLDSVRDAAATFHARSNRLDILINNAGIMAVPSGKTKDGFEIQLGVNHLGHFFLTKLLLPTLQNTAAQASSPMDVRVVNLSSMAYASTPSDGIHFKNLNVGRKPWDVWMRYGQSKLANVLFTKELAGRHSEFTTVAVHPGFINSDLWSTHWTAQFTRWMFNGTWLTVESGSHNSLWAATSPDVKSGNFYFPGGKLENGSKHSNNPKLAKALWDWSEQAVEKFQDFRRYGLSFFECRLGKSGLKVSKIIFGCMSYGNSEWGKWVLDEEATLPLLKAAYDAGINTWDTVEIYLNAQSEVIVRRAIEKFNIPSERLLILTKCFGAVDEENMSNRYGLSRTHSFDSVEASIHHLDPDVEMEETLKALVQSGMVRYLVAWLVWVKITFLNNADE